MNTVPSPVPIPDAINDVPTLLFAAPTNVKSVVPTLVIVYVFPIIKSVASIILLTAPLPDIVDLLLVKILPIVFVLAPAVVKSLIPMLTITYF